MTAVEGFVYACRLSEIPQRGKKVIQIGETRVLIIACEGKLYAVEDKCPQTGRPLSHGKVLKCTLTSPNTGATYDLNSGLYLHGGLSPFQAHWLTIFLLQVMDGEVYVHL